MLLKSMLPIFCLIDVPEELHQVSNEDGLSLAEELGFDFSKSQQKRVKIFSHFSSKTKYEMSHLNNAFNIALNW